MVRILVWLDILLQVVHVPGWRVNVFIFVFLTQEDDVIICESSDDDENEDDNNDKGKQEEEIMGDDEVEEVGESDFVITSKTAL